MKNLRNHLKADSSSKWPVPKYNYQYSPDASIRRVKTFWFADGSIVLKVHNRAFKVHQSVLQRHSGRFLDMLVPYKQRTVYDSSETKVGPDIVDGAPVYEIPSSKGVSPRDFNALLNFLYPPAIPERHEYTSPEIFRLLRISASNCLDFPAVFSQMSQRFSSMYPVLDPPDIDGQRWDNLEEALAITRLVGNRELQKEIFYIIVTQSDIDFDAAVNKTKSNPTSPTGSGTNSPAIILTESNAANGPGDFSRSNSLSSEPSTSSPIPPNPTSKLPHPQNPNANLTPHLTKPDLKRCSHLLSSLSSTFTPLLFQPASALHMQCSDALASAWSDLVVGPAIQSGEVLRPMEALKRIRNIRWEESGVCSECVAHKREEWEEEARAMWREMDGWLGLGIVEDDDD